MKNHFHNLVRNVIIKTENLSCSLAAIQHTTQFPNMTTVVQPIDQSLIKISICLHTASVQKHSVRWSLRWAENNQDKHSSSYPRVVIRAQVTRVRTCDQVIQKIRLNCFRKGGHHIEDEEKNEAAGLHCKWLSCWTWRRSSLYRYKNVNDAILQAINRLKQFITQRTC